MRRDSGSLLGIFVVARLEPRAVNLNESATQRFPFFPKSSSKFKEEQKDVAV